MEKIIYPIWKREKHSTEVFAEALLGSFTDTVTAMDTVQSLKICIVDEAVAPAAPYRMESLLVPTFDAVILVWFDAVTDRPELEAALTNVVARFHAYLVTEADQMPACKEQQKVGQRTTGMNEIVFLQQPPRLSREEWLSVWQGSHTDIAIDTQSTFGYRQNIVTRALTEGAPAIDAIIEENFPEAAIHSRMAFYDAGDDEALYQEREKIMIDSCVRFIDFDKIDCTPTSEYVLK